MTECGEGEERPDRDKPDVAALDRQPPGTLEMVQEAPDHRRVEIGEVELRWDDAGRLLHVGE